MRMNKTQAKQYLKKYGVYTLINELNYNRWTDNDDIKEIIYRVLDNIPQDILKKAQNKASR